jgi:hypothetical protein
MKNSTIYFMITNDYDLYNYYENHKKGLNAIKKKTMKKYNLTEYDWNDILKRYYEDNDFDNTLDVNGL